MKSANTESLAFIYYFKNHFIYWGNIGFFPRISVGDESVCSAGYLGSIPQSGRSGEGKGNPLRYSYLEIPCRGAWQTTAHGVARDRHDLATKLTYPNIGLEHYIGFMYVTVILWLLCTWQHAHHQKCIVSLHHHQQNTSAHFTLSHSPLWRPLLCSLYPSVYFCLLIIPHMS